MHILFLFPAEDLSLRERRLVALHVQKEGELKQLHAEVNAPKGAGVESGFGAQAEQRMKTVREIMGGVGWLDTITHLRLSKDARAQDKVRQHFLKQAEDEIAAKTQRSMGIISRLVRTRGACEYMALRSAIALRLCQEMLGQMESRYQHLDGLLYAKNVADALRNPDASAPVNIREGDETLAGLKAVESRLSTESAGMQSALEKPQEQYAQLKGKREELMRILAHFDAIRPPWNARLRELIRDVSKGDDTLRQLVNAASFVDPVLKIEMTAVKNEALRLIEELKSDTSLASQDMALIEKDINSVPLKERVKRLIDGGDFLHRELTINIQPHAVAFTVLRQHPEYPEALLLRQIGSNTLDILNNDPEKPSLTMEQSGRVRFIPLSNVDITIK